MIYHGDCEKLLDAGLKADCIIADPPDNLGLDYDGYVDKRLDYYDWLERLILKSIQAAPVAWWSIYHHHDFEIKGRLRGKLAGYELRTFMWCFTFGQNRDSDCGSGYRPILRISHAGSAWACEDIKVPSWREENGDKRAKPGGRVPLDVWDFPRVTGNSAERRVWHSTQHPEALYIRMMKMSNAVRNSPQPWKVVDLFGGTGTVLRAARALRAKNPGIQAIACEQSFEYCHRMATENSCPVFSDAGLLISEINRVEP